MISGPDALPRLLFKGEQRSLALYRTLIENWRSHLQPGHLFVGVFDSIASEPERLLAALHGFLGVASGKRYFGRLLRQRINPAPRRQFRLRWEALARGAATRMRGVRRVAKANYRFGTGVSLLLREQLSASRVGRLPRASGDNGPK